MWALVPTNSCPMRHLRVMTSPLGRVTLAMPCRLLCTALPARCCLAKGVLSTEGPASCWFRRAALADWSRRVQMPSQSRASSSSSSAGPPTEASHCLRWVDAGILTVLSASSTCLLVSCSSSCLSGGPPACFLFQSLRHALKVPWIKGWPQNARSGFQVTTSASPVVWHRLSPLVLGPLLASVLPLPQPSRLVAALPSPSNSAAGSSL